MYVVAGKNEPITEEKLRYMALNCIRSVTSRFKREYGMPIICCDEKNSWRYSVFKEYKGRRKLLKETDGMDWNSIFEIFHVIREEIRTYFPYPVLNIEGAEADDIIATLCHKFGSTSPIPLHGEEKILILSKDKDFMQLQHYSNVRQFQPFEKKFVECGDPAAFLKMHILTGDLGDDIPNVLSDDDAFLTEGKRQKSLTQKRIAEFETGIPKQWEANYHRNKMLVDLMNCVPEDLQEKIIAQYETEKKKMPRSLTKYFMEKDLRSLYDKMGDF